MKPFTRKGLHRLECAMCDGFAYATISQLETRGLPPCWCGDTLQPDRLELAMHLDANASRPMRDYQAACNSAAKGQAAHGRAGRVLKRTPEEIAAERVQDARSAAVKARRVASAANARRRGAPVEAMPF